MTTDTQKILDRQVNEWTQELKDLACKIAAAKGMPAAIVLITPKDEGYTDVVPELIAEDALQVHTYGWPEGFEFEILNQGG
ncbi:MULTISPECIES: hypothetical protein [Burkholderia]|uniref:Uncharacterized protein n=2 Tax=Burkholderia cepacia complex TaxID=87882 RepID=A0AAP1V6U8_9BURK|nr:MULTISPECIES: hypothetical protein [Burkholderia]MBK1902015.1 hypothetical protein [Burkholderia contaminans]MBK1910298.1 hypothetical protein [Burkholderia contaminans]MBK1923757.1 hypothetical protein [Burkholderia contaminans]MBK1931969.1 hypothetical protein [Burkholderia contaminans]MBK1939218.1 hypothetical protein [Burkholderia contaminans]